MLQETVSMTKGTLGYETTVTSTEKPSWIRNALKNNINREQEMASEATVWQTQTPSFGCLEERVLKSQLFTYVLHKCATSCVLSEQRLCKHSHLNTNQTILFCFWQGSTNKMKTKCNADLHNRSHVEQQEKPSENHPFRGNSVTQHIMCKILK